MEQKNLVLALVLSAVIIIGWGILQARFFPPPPVPQQTTSTPAQPSQTPPATGTQGTTTAPAVGATEPPLELVDRKTALARSPRVPIDSPRLKGSIALKGGRIDDVVLTEFRETVDAQSPNIILLSPKDAANAYFAELGWFGQGTKLPDDDTLWQADGDKLTVGKPLTLTWDNGQGVRFTRVFTLDADYMFTVDQKVENAGTTPIELHPFGRINRTGTPVIGLSRILQEGPIGAFGPTADGARLQEKQYHNLPDEYRKANLPAGSSKDCLPDNLFPSVGGWLGLNDKYWLVALVPDSTQPLQACYRWWQANAIDVYQTDYSGAPVSVPPGGKAEARASLFAGAKEVRLLDRYRDGFAGVGIPLFDRAVDFTGYLGGITYFLTFIAKPMFYLLDIIYRVIGNFGVAIMMLTVIVKGLLFPLANKSFRAMNRMKRLGPQVQELRTRLGDDKVRLNQEMMALYKREKVNPAAGCLPLLVQMPVFLALYQVLYVTIEMRQAPFFGWIRDLSVPDPTTVLNLFGLLPWGVPHGADGFLNAWGLDALPVIGHFLATLLSLFSIGVWPLVLGVTMFLQQKMNPPPPDPMQAKIFMFLPIMFTFMMAQFQAGLVIYWSWNNLLSIAQQWLLKRLDERRTSK
jgi:YidC/Oxa1 family membrane protein insertase